MAKNIRFQGLVNTTAELESDKFAGRIGWNSTLARFVAYYSSTLYAQMARRDVLETFAAGLLDSTLTAGRMVSTTTGGRLQTLDAAGSRALIGAKAGDVISVRLITARPESFPSGESIFETSSGAWPAGAAGTVMTYFVTANRCVQHNVAKDGTALYFRTANAALTDGWTGWSCIPAPSAFAKTLLTQVDAAGSRALIGAQAEDADLTAIAALSTTTYGRSLLTQADSAAARSTLGAMQKDVRAAVVQTGSGPTLTLANDDGEVRIICIAATGNTLNIYDTTTANLVTTITLSAGYHTLTISCIPGSGNTYIVQLDAVTSQAVCAGDQTGVLLFRTSSGELYFERISVT